MGRSQNLVQLVAVLFLTPWQGHGTDSCYAVYNQSFAETRITDGQAKSTRFTAKYLTLMEYDGTTISRAFRTWELRGKKNYRLIDDQDVVSLCRVLNQGARKILVSYWDALPTGRHFSWSTGPLKSYTLGTGSFLLPPTVLVKGVGVPKDTDPNLKEYQVTGVLDWPATQAVNQTYRASDQEAESALRAYLVSKGFTFN